MMQLKQMIEVIKNRPDAGQIGMILTHIGLVRQVSRDGRRVSGLTVAVDRDQMKSLVEKEKQSPGIIDIRVEIEEGRLLAVGDEIMRLVVAGDVRDNVIPVLERVLSAVKERVTHKTEVFA